MNKGLFTSNSGEWETPQELFDSLCTIYGGFTLDAAASDSNAKCAKYYTVETDGLKQDWQGHKVFCNPPYGRNIGKWVEKGYTEAKKAKTSVVMLLPARTDTRWFHDYCIKGQITFLKGRIKFGGGNHPAPFPSMVCYFEGGGK